MEWPNEDDYPPTFLLGMPPNVMDQMHQSNNEAPSTPNDSNAMPSTVDQTDNILPSLIIEDISNNTRSSRNDVTHTTGNQFCTRANTSDTLDDPSTSKSEVAELQDLLLSWKQEHLLDILVSKFIFKYFISIRLHNFKI